MSKTPERENAVKLALGRRLERLGLAAHRVRE
jgi:hypothetical protein